MNNNLLKIIPRKDDLICVLSFDVTGKDKLIEVKTTSFGKETPFFITRNEVDLSRTEAEHFHLYRLFDFRKEPRLFKFRGTYCNRPRVQGNNA